MGVDVVQCAMDERFAHRGIEIDDTTDRRPADEMVGVIGERSDHRGGLRVAERGEQRERVFQARCPRSPASARAGSSVYES